MGTPNDSAGSGYAVDLSISAVERDTGLSKDTLRVWERRYGFPTPLRDHLGERHYPVEQVERLRLIRRLMDAGHRPGKIMRMNPDQLAQLASQIRSAATPRLDADHPLRNDLAAFMSQIKRHQVDDLRRALSQAALRLGLDRFVRDVAAPLNALVGDAWARNQIEIFEEHLYTESMQVVLRNAISNIPGPGRSPRVLLTTFPQEPHGLGLLMAEAILALEGCRCLSLGVQTPIYDIAMAASAQRAEIVGLSFSASMNPNHVLDGLTELRAKLAFEVEIWAGGQCPILQRRPPPDVRVIAGLAGIHEALRAWRTKHAAGAPLS
jgi:DNA-binding transcriptional MerR regulator/methylmalonyl-CoA mutase cobalamin-binding subunit